MNLHFGTELRPSKSQTLILENKGRDLDDGIHKVNKSRVGHHPQTAPLSARAPHQSSTPKRPHILVTIKSGESSIHSPEVPYRNGACTGVIFAAPLEAIKLLPVNSIHAAEGAAGGARSVPKNQYRF